MGHAQAKPRHELLAYLNAAEQGHRIGDRQMRRAYESIDKVGSCGRGLFWITNAEDRHIAQSQLVAPAAAMFKRERKIGASVETGQGSLFGGEA
jgi:hypothetical protein